MKPDQTAGEATGASSQRTFRGGWGQRAWIDQSRSLGGPTRRRAKARNVRREDITVARPCRESEGSIVAGKRGNARGAKGPCWKHFWVKGGEQRADEKPTTNT